MKTDILYISKKIHFKNGILSVISFHKFIDFLEEGIRSASHLKVPYFKWILKKFDKLPELSGGVDLDQVIQYEEMLELVSTCLIPLAADEKTLWALSSPLSPDIFYSTDGFYDLIQNLKTPTALNPELHSTNAETESIMTELQYGMVLEKIYKLPYLKKTDWIRKFHDPQSGLDKYYQVNIDNRFVDIEPLGTLPSFDCSTLLPSSVWGEEFKKIQNQLPLDRFQARGFSMVTLNDVTAQQAIEQIGKLIINNDGTDPVGLFHEINHSLQTIAGSNHYEFGIVPFLSINDRPALLYRNFPFSIIIQACWQFEVSKKEFTNYRNNFARNPRTVVWSAREKENDLPELISQAFVHAGISTYMLFPVYYNEALIGIFEIATRLEHSMMSEEQLLRLRPALALITQLIKNLIAHFNTHIENIIKDKFTNIQPAVQWKFNEAAWHYLRDHVEDARQGAIESITFPELVPFYGATDIRNSTILRNQAAARDYKIQLNILMESLRALDTDQHASLNRLVQNAETWLRRIAEPLTTQQEIQLNEFFDQDLQPELELIQIAQPGAGNLLRPYYQAIEEQGGIAFENRRQLEAAIQHLNGVMDDFYEKAALDLQEIYPCYFEKFRTDGVEYDIYVGQSIAPKKPFGKDNLQQIKRWQLESMIKLVHLMQKIIPEMVYPLQTTQLLFIHPQTIDITFRKDERRFDVEGAYNIRYHIIKKRIDKVLIAGREERLTQPGKIALVYFNERDILEYKTYIRELQDLNLLQRDLEELELEPMQGVNGLRALRVGLQPEAYKTEYLQQQIHS